VSGIAVPPADYVELMLQQWQNRKQGPGHRKPSRVGGRAATARERPAGSRLGPLPAPRALAPFQTRLMARGLDPRRQPFPSASIRGEGTSRDTMTALCHNELETCDVRVT